MTPGTGWRACRFVCSYEDADLVVARLQRWNCVDQDRVTYRDGAVHFEIELARLPLGDGTSAALMVHNDLGRCVSRHRLPTEPPPKDEVA